MSNPNAALKLNLGSGQNPKPGFVNVDKYGSPDMVCDLEQFPWPWPDSSVEQIELCHVLEHLGATTDIFIGIIKEIYRVCRDGATVNIAVPHPRCDDFLNDPTHVRIVTADMMTLFSKRMNLEWKQTGAANSPLALYHNVDFEIVKCISDLTPIWNKRLKTGVITQEQLAEIAGAQNNVIKQLRIELRVVKPG